jgi:hypothetical protein
MHVMIIQQIKLGNGADDYNGLYLVVFNRFRHTLTYLDINYGGSLDFLAEFVCLTHLSLTNEEGDTLDFFDILHLCPDLVSLKYISYLPISDNQAEEKLKDMKSPLLLPKTRAN